MLDAGLIFEDYVNQVAKTCNFCGLCNICLSISQDVITNTCVVPCIVGTCLDYWNLLIYGASEKSLNKLQSPEQAPSAVSG